MTDAITWEKAAEAEIDEQSYYVVQHNGGEWRDFDLAVMSGPMVRRRLEQDYVRGRPVWIAKINRPAQLCS